MSKKSAILLAIAVLTAWFLVLANWAGKSGDVAHAQMDIPTNVGASNGTNPSEVVVSWDPVAGATLYRVGWLAVADYQDNIEDDQWRERFAYSDVNANSSFTVTRLTPSTAYYFIIGRKEGNDIAWSQWATLTLRSGELPCSGQPAVAPSTTSTLQVANGSNPGEVVVSWDAETEASGYRVGWLAVPDFVANQDDNRWQERFAYSDINPASSFTVTRLTPGVPYYFIMGRKQDDGIAWSQWAALVLNPNPAACPASEPVQTFPASAIGGDYDHDNDGLIEVRTLAQLDVIRLDRDGDSLVEVHDLPQYLDTFPGALDDMGCPSTGCNGYELAADLDFDTNDNGEADAGDAYWNEGTGWEPIQFGTDEFYSTETFDGNGYTIANLYINRPAANYVGLFEYNEGDIRNVVLHDVDVNGGDSTGALVGLNLWHIEDSSASGEVFGNNIIGGLVGYNDGAIINGTADSSVSANNVLGGLVGANSGAIINGTASGAMFGNSTFGGLVGYNSIFGQIRGSLAYSSVSGKYDVGGLVGQNLGRMVDHTAWRAFHAVQRDLPFVGRQPPRWSIVDSTANGDVSGKGKIGGLVGHNEGAFTGSAASGMVSGENDIGGLVGSNTWGATENNTSSGEVLGNNRVGGLFGSNIRGTIKDSEASGSVSADDRAGGLVGINDGPISGSTANGVVSGNDYVGGLVGYNTIDGSITDSASSGAVSGNDHVGGLVGYNHFGVVISGSNAKGDATGQSYVGGLVGANYGTIADCTATGNVAGVMHLGALVGGNNGRINNSTGSGTVTTLQ